MSKITNINAREILDSRGNPTIEVGLVLDDKYCGMAAVPSGASTGAYEAVELRDGDKSRYFGKGVLKAVSNVSNIISKSIIKKDIDNQKTLDKKLIELDGTETKRKLEANAILAVSLAYAKAKANETNLRLFESMRKSKRYVMPLPMMNILNGGVHADNNVDIQEFMIVPVKGKRFSEALRFGVEVYHSLKKVLKGKKLSTSVGDEGGFAPNLRSNEEALDLLIEAIELNKLSPGKDVLIALDVASNELFKNGKYKIGEKGYTSKEMIDFYERLVSKYPIVSIEDGLGENDWDGWIELTKRLGKKIQLIGDDLFVTNVKKLEDGIKKRVANAILIKLNQIGTLTETFEAIDLAKSKQYRTIISHRSGETEDSTIADLAVASSSGQIKTGAPCRSDRTSKYNQLIRIESELGDRASFIGSATYESV